MIMKNLKTRIPKDKTHVCSLVIITLNLAIKIAY